MSKLTIEERGCNCHPENCCCNPYTICIDGEKVGSAYEYPKALVDAWKERTLPPAVVELVEAVKALDLHLLPKRKPENYMHCFRPCDKVNRVVEALAALADQSK